ncbi:hypothetical protein IQ247_28510 [Plectonema cf. radiosum LEGE 06105]|uniref:DUF6737 domain-containing protein n=1 Tax=Plectonema cf. radiosum LEGE 06105 TaxID=945769 RepID=A0A8J7F6X6_9CYAN|nr:DUF6737 family protein [Plectonema radiosum]MBE9216555.1 hypothetical protein [Plectonema cf. radiosum LEGE 06105]
MTSNKPINVWQYKPWWCQPWSILLTGATLITVSWLLFHKVWLTILVSIPLLTWMSFFLLIYPRIFIKSVTNEMNKD